MIIACDWVNSPPIFLAWYRHHACEGLQSLLYHSMLGCILPLFPLVHYFQFYYPFLHKYVFLMSLFPCTCLISEKFVCLVSIPCTKQTVHLLLYSTAAHFSVLAKELSSLDHSGLGERTPVCQFLHFVALMLKLGLKTPFLFCWVTKAMLCPNTSPSYPCILWVYIFNRIMLFLKVVCVLSFFINLICSFLNIFFIALMLPISLSYELACP